jgi:hypothetical protein
MKHLTGAVVLVGTAPSSFAGKSSLESSFVHFVKQELSGFAG